MCLELQRYLADADLNQQTLAGLLGVRQPTISRWISGRIPAERVLEVSRVTGIPAFDLRPDIYPDEAA